MLNINHLDVNWITALIALITAVITAVALILQNRSSNMSLYANLILNLDDRFYENSEMKTKRVRAAKSILNSPDDEIDAILDFFELIALLLNKKALDKEMVWNTFYTPVIMYWHGSYQYIKTVRKSDPHCWEDLEKMVKVLITIETEKGDYKEITDKMIKDFMKAEKTL